MSIKGRTALVTGGSQGIGEEIARALAAEGANVAVVASSSAAKAQKVAERLGERGARAVGYACDVRDDAAVVRLVSQVNRDLGRIDILINAAGVYLPSPAGDTPRQALDEMIDINLKGTWNVINAVTPQMRAAKDGRIVNIASAAGLIGAGGYAVYCASKAGVILMTRALAAELGREGIRVNAIAPGNTATAMNEDVRLDPARQHERDFIASRTPSTRLFAEPSEIAAGVLFVLSDAARSMRGACLSMDEGVTAGL